MNYFIINNIHTTKIICSQEPVDGQVIYSGHKLAINEKLLAEILQYYYDKTHSRFIFIDYMKWQKLYAPEEISQNMTDCFFYNRDNKKGLQMSYATLIDMIKSQWGNVRKINFIRISDN